MLGCMLLAGGCADLEPMEDPDVMDHHLTIDTMRAAARESERNLADLRLELDSQRQEFSAAIIARAQLEGRLREVERRLADARHIIDLQREELTAMRAERERSSKQDATQAPRSKPKSKHTAPLERSSIEQVPPNVPSALVPPVVSAPAQSGESPPSISGLSEPELLPVQPPTAPVSQLKDGTAAITPRQDNGLDVGSLVRSVAVQSGDTLWRLARRYGVEVQALRAMNGLSGDLIQVGQALMIPETGIR
ncbi:MAG: LysM peptidoglycan-binding domain-containing protein [Nitrospiraceae bacterium]